MDNPPEGFQDTKIDQEKKKEQVNESANETDNESPLKSFGKASRLPLNLLWAQDIRREKRKKWLEEHKFQYYTIQVIKLVCTLLIQPIILMMTLAEATAGMYKKCPTEEDLIPLKAENLQTNRPYQSCIDFSRTVKNKPIYV